LFVISFIVYFLCANLASLGCVVIGLYPHRDPEASPLLVYRVPWP
jgi:hypothetical protein